MNSPTPETPPVPSCYTCWWVSEQAPHSCEAMADIVGDRITPIWSGALRVLVGDGTLALCCKAYRRRCSGEGMGT